jgi:SAM-dependent methyltransferase
MNIAAPHRRLDSLWGLIDRQHNELIARHLVGKRVLDVGCGYGSLVEYLRLSGYDAQGIDFDPASVETAHRLFPEAAVRLENAETMEHYSAGAFDSIVLKDALHHLVCEGNFRTSSQVFRRLLVPGGRLVILDPNPMWILKAARCLAAHDDVEVSPKRAAAELHQNGFEVGEVEFYEILGLPLSGGYVGVRLAPNLAPINGAVAALNRLASSAANHLGLGRWLCWRYIVHADRAATEADKKPTPNTQTLEADNRADSAEV